MTLSALRFEDTVRVPANVTPFVFGRAALALAKAASAVALAVVSVVPPDVARRFVLTPEPAIPRSMNAPLFGLSFSKNLNLFP